MAMRSKAEVDLLNQLRTQLDGFSQQNYECGKFNWTDPTTHTYTPDFYLGEHIDGSDVYLEAKGLPTHDEVNKLVNVQRCNPSVKFWVLIYRDSKRYRDRPGTWSEYYQQKGIPCFVGRIPAEYLQQLKSYKPDQVMLTVISRKPVASMED